MKVEYTAHASREKNILKGKYTAVSWAVSKLILKEQGWLWHARSMLLVMSLGKQFIGISFRWRCVETHGRPEGRSWKFNGHFKQRGKIVLVLGNYYCRTGDAKTTHHGLLVKNTASCHVMSLQSLRMRTYSDLHHRPNGCLPINLNTPTDRPVQHMWHH